MTNSVAILAPEYYPVPALRGGALSIWAQHVVGHLTADKVVVISATDDRLPRKETIGNVTYIRVAEDRVLSAAARIVRRLPIVGRRLGPQLQGYAYFRALRPYVHGMDLIYVLNRPQFLPGLKSIVPNAKIILRLGNVHVKSPKHLKKADWIDCCSEFVAVHVREAVQRNSGVGAITPGIDCQLFRPCRDGEREETRKFYNVPSETFAVFFVGRLVPDKGIELLLEAGKLLQDRLPVQFLIAGSASDKSYDDLLRGQAPDNFHFLGQKPQAEVASLMRMSDIFVGPSLWDEPAGRVFGEAMASATPVVATRRGGIPETVAAAGSGVLLPPAPTATQLADEIESLLLDRSRRDKYAVAGRKWAIENLDWTVIGRRTDNLIGEVIGIK